MSNRITIGDLLKRTFEEGNLKNLELLLGVICDQLNLKDVVVELPAEVSDNNDNFNEDNGSPVAIGNVDVNGDGVDENNGGGEHENSYDEDDGNGGVGSEDDGVGDNDDEDDEYGDRGDSIDDGDDDDEYVLGTTWQYGMSRETNLLISSMKEEIEAVKRKIRRFDSDLEYLAEICKEAIEDNNNKIDMKIEKLHQKFNELDAVKANFEEIKQSDTLTSIMKKLEYPEDHIKKVSEEKMLDIIKRLQIFEKFDELQKEITELWKMKIEKGELIDKLSKKIEKTEFNILKRNFESLKTIVQIQTTKIENMEKNLKLLDERLNKLENIKSKKNKISIKNCIRFFSYLNYK